MTAKRTRAKKEKGKAKPRAAAAPSDPYGDKEWLESKRTPHKSLDEEQAEDRARLRDAIAEGVEEARARTEALGPLVHRPQPVGRPTEYKPEFADQAEKLCRLGATDPEIADFFEVDRTTIWRWSQRHEEFCNALRAGKDYADERVVRSLYQRAVGYHYEGVKVFMPAGAAQPVYAAYTEHVAPDVNAASKWLNNRRPLEWRDKFEHVHNFDPSKMSDADLARIAAGGGEGVVAPARDPKLTH